MGFSESLAERIRAELDKKGVTFKEKKMMGGLTFMVNDKMCIGIVKDTLMARIDPEICEQALSKKGSREMDFTGRPMNGFVFVDPEGLETNGDLEYWVQQCLDYNPRAKSSKKK
jgi:TfoX/Sxy family transcriptional regulator of competence genes